jgi:hypothetical protein
MSISMGFLRTKRKADGLDVIVIAVIIVAVLAFFGFISLGNLL